jgi:hypothetical protein
MHCVDPSRCIKLNDHEALVVCILRHIRTNKSMAPTIHAKNTVVKIVSDLGGDGTRHKLTLAVKVCCCVFLTKSAR